MAKQLPLEVEVQKRKKVTTTNEDGTISEGYKYRLDITGDEMPVFWTATFGDDILQPGAILELSELVSQATLDETDNAQDDEEAFDEEEIGDMRAYLANVTVDELRQDLKEVTPLPLTEESWDNVSYGYVSALLEAETTGPGRDSALDVIAAKMDEIEDEAKDTEEETDE